MKIRHHLTTDDLLLTLAATLNCLQYMGAGAFFYDIWELESQITQLFLGVIAIFYIIIVIFITSKLIDFIKSHEGKSYAGCLVIFFSISLVLGGWVAIILPFEPVWIFTGSCLLLAITFFIFVQTVTT
ncbi:MAG: hypothetical protein WD335_03990 [Candidatus Paceibacterota bacterium]